MASAASPELFPVHRLVWANHYRELDALLAKKENDAEMMDTRGR